ncbi:MAG: BACON domain-containing protein [Bacteroidales bacterium]|nr:BACON domain-containing protein [Bacteroidales bacterium]
MKRPAIFLWGILLFSTISCTDYLSPRYNDIVALGATNKSVTIDAEPNTCMFRLTSNVDFGAYVVSGSEWLKFEENGSDQLLCYASRRNIKLRATANRGFPRMGIVTLEAEGRADTLFVKQEGQLEPFVQLQVTDLTAAPEGGTYRFTLETNLPARDIRTQADMEGILSVTYEESTLTVVMSPNDGRNDRHIHLDVYSITQWREKIGSVLNITQKKIQ